MRTRDYAKMGRGGIPRPTFKTSALLMAVQLAHGYKYRRDNYFATASTSSAAFWMMSRMR